jgi:hypothetical protein
VRAASDRRTRVGVASDRHIRAVLKAASRRPIGGREVSSTLRLPFGNTAPPDARRRAAGTARPPQATHRHRPQGPSRSHFGRDSTRGARRGTGHHREARDASLSSRHPTRREDR